MVKELVIKNRSYRGFDPDFHFSKDMLMAYVDAARLTASSINQQPLKYYLAWEPEQTAIIQPLTGWARALPEMKLPHAGKEPTAFIVICQDMQINNNLQRFQKDVGIVAQTILLMAAEEDLGGCMIGNFNPKLVQNALDLSENMMPMLIIALGKPAESIILTEVGEDGNTDYYRDEEDVHYVPKRSMDEILIN